MASFCSELEQRDSAFCSEMGETVSFHSKVREMDSFWSEV